MKINYRANFIAAKDPGIISPKQQTTLPRGGLQRPCRPAPVCWVDARFLAACSHSA